MFTSDPIDLPETVITRANQDKLRQYLLDKHRREALLVGQNIIFTLEFKIENLAVIWEDTPGYDPVINRFLKWVLTSNTDWDPFRDHNGGGHVIWDMTTDEVTLHTYMEVMERVNLPRFVLPKKD